MSSPFTHRFRLFRPILAGATLKERAIGCLGALIAISLAGLITGLALGQGAHLPLIVAPMGASAVLLFAVPASPLAQPWPVIGGNVISAFVGVIVARLVSDPVLGSGLAVSLAIGVMSLTRSLHPPGGAAALTAVVGGQAVTGAGFAFPFVPVGINAVLMVLLAIAYHRLTRRNYPHVLSPAAKSPELAGPILVGFNDEDVDNALATLNETFDIGREDLNRVLRQVEMEAMARTLASRQQDTTKAKTPA